MMKKTGILVMAVTAACTFARAAQTAPAAGAGRLTLAILPGECWWGGAVTEARDQPFGAESKNFTLDTRKHHGKYGGNQAAPLLLSSKGRWVWCEQAFVTTVKDGVLVLESEKAAPFVTGAEKGGTLRDAFLHCSKAYFPPKGTPKLRFFEQPIINTWAARKYNVNQENTLSLAKSFLTNGVPPGVFMIDCYWQAGFGTWDFNRERFPDPKGLIKEMNALGYPMMLWHCPEVTTDTAVYRYLRKEGMLLKGPTADGVADSLWWEGKSAILDCTNPKTFEWLRKDLQRVMDTYGVEGFFFDSGDPGKYRPETTPFQKGATPSEQTRAFHMIGLDVPYQQHRASWKMGGLPLMQTLRDKGSTYEEIRHCIQDGIEAGLLGYPFVVFDMVGGGSVEGFVWDSTPSKNEHLDTPYFFKHAKADEAQAYFLRSLETQCLSPMIQFSLSPFELLDAKHQQMVRDLVALRQQWAPYIVECAKAAGRTGEPMMRSLEYAYPGHGWERVDDEFLMGDKLLVAPQVYKDAFERKVVIPPGEWKADDGALVTGPAVITVKTPLERLPYFVKAAAASVPTHP